MEKDFFEQSKHRSLLFILAILSYVLLMLGNGIISLTHPDEVFYVQTVKEMLAHKSWLTPIIFDQPHFEKPILFFWMLAVVIKFFGLSPFVARFWPAFFGMVGVGAVYGIALMLFQRKRLAFFSSIILASSFIYLALSRAVLTDMVFTIFVTISIGFFYTGYQYERYRVGAIILSFVTSALAVLTKGILGFLFPTLVVFLFLIYRKDLVFLKSSSVFWGLLLFVLIALPWHVFMVKLYGQRFIDEYIFNVHIRRFFEAEHAKLNHWYFYPGLMFAGILPWTFYLGPAAVLASQHVINKNDGHFKLFFLFSWIAGVFVCIEPAASKLASYIFPVFPAIAIIIAYYLDYVLILAQKGVRLRAFHICHYLMILFFIGIAFAGIIAAKMYRDILVNILPVYCAATLLVVVIGCLIFFKKCQDYVKMVLTPCTVTFILLITLFFVRPYVETWVSCKDISEVFKRLNDQSDTVVLTSKFYVRGVRYYTDRKMAVIDVNGKGFFSPHPIPFLNTDQKVLEFLESQPITYAIVKEGNKRDLERINSHGRFKIETLEGLGGKYLLKIEKI